MSEPTGTWEPDWKALTRVGQIRHKITVQLVIEEYRRQQIERGRVEVPLEFLVTMRNITQKYPPDGGIEMVTEVLTNLIAHHERPGM
jgi:hypothetical protein